MKVDRVQYASSLTNCARWQLVHEFFEQLRHAPRSAWHTELKAVASDDPALAYEVLSLLVADQSVEDSQVHS